MYIMRAGLIEPCFVVSCESLNQRKHCGSTESNDLGETPVVMVANHNYTEVTALRISVSGVHASNGIVLESAVPPVPDS